MCTITVIDRFLSADRKRVLYEYTRSLSFLPGREYVSLDKPVKQGFVPVNITDSIAYVDSDMTVVNESVASDKDCVVTLKCTIGGKDYEFKPLTVKPGTLISRQDDYSYFPGDIYSDITGYVSYNEGEELPYSLSGYIGGYCYIFDDVTLLGTYPMSDNTYPVVTIDRYYNRAGEKVSEVIRDFTGYRVGESVTKYALSNLSGYRPRKATKTINVTSGTNEIVLEYDECDTYTVTIKDKYYDTDGVTLLEEQTRPAQTYNAGENVTVYYQNNNLYSCAEQSKTVTNIQADMEIEFVYVKKAAYTIDITYVCYEADGVTEIKRETKQMIVFAGDYCYLDTYKPGYYHTLADTRFIPDKDMQIEVAFYEYSTITAVFHVKDSEGNEIDEVKEEVPGLKNGLQTVYVTAPKYTSPSTCQKEVEISDGMEVSFDVTAVPTQVTVTDYFGTIASYWSDYDYMTGQEAASINKRGIEDTANGDILENGSYCFLPTEVNSTRTVEMNYGDSEDKLLGSHKGWKIIPQYKNSNGYSINIRVAAQNYNYPYISNYEWVFGYDSADATSSPLGNRCYYVRSNIVTVTADGKTYTADSDGKITTPTDPADKEGYEFKGWSRTDGDTDPDNKIDFGSEVFETDTEIYPIWVAKSSAVTVTADGKDYKTNQHGYLTSANRPTDPTPRAGYEFKGWSRTEGDTDESNKLDFSNEVFTEDTTIYPIWVAAVTTVTVTAEGKTYTADENGKISEPPVVYDPQNSFKGWSRTEGDTDESNKIDFDTEVFTESTTIHPIWKPKTMTSFTYKYIDHYGKIVNGEFVEDSSDVRGTWPYSDMDTLKGLMIPSTPTTKYPEVYKVVFKGYRVDSPGVVEISGKYYYYDEDALILTEETFLLNDITWRNPYASNTRNWLDWEDPAMKGDEFCRANAEVHFYHVSTFVTVTADGKTYTAGDDGKIRTPDNPAPREGYIFKGWSRIEGDTDPNNKIDFGNEVFDADTEVYPIWVLAPVVTADGKTYPIDNDGHIRTPDVPTDKEGYIFGGWSRTPDDTDRSHKLDFSDEVFEDDTEVYPIWIKEYTVTANGKEYKTDIDGHIPTPDKPDDREGYIFKGWSKTPDDNDPDNDLDFTSEVFEEDTEIYPIWVKRAVVTADEKTYIVDDNGKITTPTDPADKEGYIFAGWSRTEDDTDKSHKLDFTSEEFEEDTEIYPIWVKEHTVTAGDKTYKTDIDGHIPTPDKPDDRDGYIFKGWSRTPDDTNPDNKLDFDDEVFDGDTEVYPIWVKRAVVTADEKTYIVDDDGKIRTPDAPSEKPGYIFAGWSRTEGDTDKSHKLDFSSEVFETDTEVYPIWVEQFTVTADGKAYETDIDGHIPEPDEPDEKPGYIFGGWSRKPDETNPDNKLDFTEEEFDGDTEIYPIWVKEVTVIADGKTYKTDINGHIQTPDAPSEKPGYIFGGWSRTEGDEEIRNKIDFVTEVFEDDTEVYPIWVKEHIVIAGGKEYKTDIDGHIPTPDKPDKKPGYIFKGWSRTEGDTDPDNKLDFTGEVFTEDTEVYPIWVKAVIVTADGKDYEVDDDGHIRTPDDPAGKDGYIFGGWSRTEGDADLDGKLDFNNEVFTEDTEVYPIWVKEHTVIAGGKEYKTDINGHTPTPDKPEDKPGYIFVGWSHTEGDTDPGNKLDFTGEVFTSDGEVYPIWVEKASVVTVTADGKTYIADGDGHISTPTAPAAKPGYIFKGWSRTEGDTNPNNKIDFSNEVFTSDTEVYPIWVREVSGGGSSSGGGSGRKSSSSNSGSYQELSGSWVYLEDGRWRFKLTDGSEIIGKWAYLKNPYAVTSLGQNDVDWFRFDDEGYMVTGWWTDVDGNVYYLHPVSDGSQGHMYTGWHWLEGADGLLRCYYFNTESDGTRGALYRSKTTPDGSVVDESGAWVVGNGAVTREAVKTAEEVLTVAKDSTFKGILRSINRMFNL